MATLTVNRLAQTITFAALRGQRVDTALFSLTVTASSGLPVSFSSSNAAVATVSSNTVILNGIGSTTITASQAGDATYLPASSVNQTLAVAGIPVGISSQPTGLTVNVTATATFTVTATGTDPLAYQWRKNGVIISSATNSSYSLPSVLTNHAGNYTVVITNAWGSITSSVAALTVKRLAQAITFAVLPNKRVGDAPFNLTATASSGLPVSYSSSAPTVAKVIGSTVTLIRIGSTTITASQAGNATYLPATNVRRTLAVAGSQAGISSLSGNAVLQVQVPPRLMPPEKLANGSFRLRFRDVDGGALAKGDQSGFTLQWSANLVNWFDLTNATRTVVNGTVELEDADAAGQARRFYRVLER